jgi:small subunit ribosomal protein S16
MLAIRMQRTGRKGHAQFRMVVQDSRFNSQSGRVVAYLGFYDPHAKTATLDGEKVSKYLENGAQPSDRAVRILQSEGIKLPNWVKAAQPKEANSPQPGKTPQHYPQRGSREPAETPAATEETAIEEQPASEK